MPQPPELYVFFGLIASGKSTLAEAWAERIGAVYANSDVLRKELAGLKPAAEQSDSFGKGIYTPEFTRKTYDAMLCRAGSELTLGRSAVLDASYSSEAERRMVLDLAESHQVLVRFVLCICPEPLMKERMEIRARDPLAVSDGRWEIYLQQKKKFVEPKELDQSQLIVINTDKPVELLISELESLILRQQPPINAILQNGLKEITVYKRMYILRFPKENIDQPIICMLVKKYDIEFNILKADIFLHQDGIMVLELAGHKRNVQSGIKYLKNLGVKVESVATSIRRDDDKCYQCGVCTGICAAGALHIERPEMAVVFEPDKCTGCGLCVQVCPVRAMEIFMDRNVSSVAA